jgi:hypothetical protein
MVTISKHPKIQQRKREVEIARQDKRQQWNAVKEHQYWANRKFGTTFYHNRLSNQVLFAGVSTGRVGAFKKAYPTAACPSREPHFVGVETGCEGYEVSMNIQEEEEEEQGEQGS